MTALNSVDAEQLLEASEQTGLRPSRKRGGRGRAPGRRPRRRKALFFYWFALPSFALVLVFFLVPFVANLFFAFTQWTGYSDTIRFNGLDNFITLDKLGLIWHAVGVTLVYAITGMLVQNTIGLTLAKALQRNGRIDTFFRSLYFVPVLISPLAAGYIWSAVLTPDGPLNQLISIFVPGFDFYWLGGNVSALLTVAVIDAWKWSGLATLIYIAGLNRIPGQIIDAARMDGAGGWRRFWSIEFPLLAPSFTFNIIITLVSAFSALDIVFSTTNGGPGNATAVLNYALYAQYGNGLFGTASALGLIITVMVVVAAVPMLAILRRREVRM
ncbi:MAG: sugar ABC transporter permease [Microbacterium sp.]|uniref:carbohydrate ABC transporter permease n=1 Tax=Microbacterium sp. TaxID=51671 RepID=UPI0039E4EE97